VRHARAWRDATRIAALYDIHGNLPALEATLRDVRNCGADLVVIGGDVLPGRMPTETYVVSPRMNRNRVAG
jgi:hypothetical protein